MSYAIGQTRTRNSSESTSSSFGSRTHQRPCATPPTRLTADGINKLHRAMTLGKVVVINKLTNLEKSPSDQNGVSNAKKLDKTNLDLGKSWKDIILPAIESTLGTAGDSSIGVKDEAVVSSETVYRVVTDVCRGETRACETLHDLLYDRLCVYVDNKLVKDLQNALMPFDPDTSKVCEENDDCHKATTFCQPKNVIATVCDIWERHCCMAETLRSLLLPMEQALAMSLSRSPSEHFRVGVLDLLRGMCRTKLLEKKLIDKICTFAASVIVEVRQSNLDEIDGILSIAGRGVTMIRCLGFFNSHFNSVFLQSLENFYAVQACKNIEVMETSGYLDLLKNFISLEKRIHEEGRLLPETWWRQKATLIEQFVASRVDNLTGIVRVRQLLDLGDFRSIKRMISLLLTAVNDDNVAVSKLKISFQAALAEKGTLLMSEYLYCGITAAAANNMLQSVFSLHSDVEELLSSGDDKNSYENGEKNGLDRKVEERRATIMTDFRAAVNESFATFLNPVECSSKPAQLLAKYVDEMMQRSRNVREEEFQNDMAAVRRIFEHIKDKDIFEAFYRRDLAYRILKAFSSRTFTTRTLADEERVFLQLMKEVCGFAFVSKSEAMLNDYETSQTCTNEFASKDVGSNFPELNVQLATSGLWPSFPEYSSETVEPPHSVSEGLAAFSRWYRDKYAQRRLTWSSMLSSAVIRYTRKSQQKNLVVSAAQAVVLTECFNEADSCAHAEIETVLKISRSEVRRVLAPLLNRVKILKQEGDIVSLNDDFFRMEKRRHIVVPLVAIKNEQVEKESVDKRVTDDRLCLIEASIVRVMKNKKSLMHNQLISAVINECRGKFVPEVSEIKKRTEALIEREYLEREEGIGNKYRYLA